MTTLCPARSARRHLASAIALPAAIALFSAAGTACLAQEQQGGRPPLPPSPPSAPAPAAAPSNPGTGSNARRQASTPDLDSVLSVDFRGGTLAKFVDEVRSQAARSTGAGAGSDGAGGQIINVVYPADVANVEVPPVTLRNVTPLVALQSLEYTTRPTIPSAPGRMMVVRVSPISVLHSGSGGAPTFAVSLQAVPGVGPEPVGSSPFGPSSAVITKVFSVRDLLSDSSGGDADGGVTLSGLTLDQIVQPIETALTVDAGDGTPAEGSQPRVLVHRESNLIILRGSQRQVELARQVLDRLRDDVETTRQRGRADREYKIALKEVSEQRKAELAALEKLVHSAHDRFEIARKQYDDLRGSAPADAMNLESAKRQVEEAERFLTSAVQQRERMMADAATIEVAARKLAAERASTSDQARALREQLEELRRQIDELKSPKGR